MPRQIKTNKHSKLHTTSITENHMVQIMIIFKKKIYFENKKIPVHVYQHDNEVTCMLAPDYLIIIMQ